MDVITILNLIKARKGISINTRDTFLIAIIESRITELEDEKGIVLDAENMNHTLFIVDYATYRYENKESDKVLPRNLQYRLHNLMIHNKGGA